MALPDGNIVSQVPVGDFPHDATATASGTVAVDSATGRVFVALQLIGPEADGPGS